MKKKSKIVLLDGPDGSGKTTVAQLLHEKTGLPIIKMPRMPEYFKTNAEEMSKLFNETIIQFSDFSFILDRGFPSSMVYSKVFNRNEDLSYLAYITKVLHPKIYILTATDKELFRRKPVDEIIPKEDRIKINVEYQRLAGIMNWKLIDTTDLEDTQVCSQILSSL